MCFLASAALVKKPVDSITMSAFRSPQGKFAGSRSSNTLMVFPPTVMESDVYVTGRSRRPSMESYFKRCAKVALSVRSLIPTISKSAPEAKEALKKLRPIRPKPLIPTRITIFLPSSYACIIARSIFAQYQISLFESPQRCDAPTLSG